MPSLGMRGPYKLSPQQIDEEVKPSVPGVFATGYVKESGAFVVRYIGRSDRDVRTELKTQETDIGARFKWVEATSQHEAFELQCRLYHEFGGSIVLENEEHPERPKGANWQCPDCNFFHRR